MRRLLLLSSSRVHGSGYLGYCHGEMRELLGDARRVLFVPHALHDRDGYAGMARRRFAELGWGLDSLHAAGDPAAAVASAEALFIGGGNTFRLLSCLYELDLLPAILSRVEAGMPYMGASAGSNVACPTIKTTNDMPIVQPPSFVALGLVPFNINAHYLDPDPDSTHQGETRETRIREFHEENDPPVIGLREGGMLEIRDGRMRLRGTAGARIFHQGATPREAAPGDDLSDLLAPGTRKAAAGPSQGGR